MAHIPVLLHEAVAALNLRPESIVFDCTLGGGGHGRAILEELGPRGAYVGIDADPAAVAAAEIPGKARVHLVNDNFANVKAIAASLGLRPDAILADLGWRSEQFEGGGRGFSFQTDEPLLMTFGDPAKQLFTAFDVVNGWEESSLADIIYGFGEERFARRVAEAIVEARRSRPIERSRQLAEIVMAAYPARARRGRLHPATKTFQAIRMAVNDELGKLETLLADGFDLLAPSGRFAVITFHSLEDRLVKQAFNARVKSGEARKLTKKPVIAGREELAENPRARSAKLRAIEKT